MLDWVLVIWQAVPIHHFYRLPCEVVIIIFPFYGWEANREVMCEAPGVTVVTYGAGISASCLYPTSPVLHCPVLPLMLEFPAGHSSSTADCLVKWPCRKLFSGLGKSTALKDAVGPARCASRGLRTEHAGTGSLLPLALDVVAPQEQGHSRSAFWYLWHTGRSQRLLQELDLSPGETLSYVFCVQQKLPASLLNNAWWLQGCFGIKTSIWRALQ